MGMGAVVWLSLFTVASLHATLAVVSQPSCSWQRVSMTHDFDVFLTWRCLCFRGFIALSCWFVCWFVNSYCNIHDYEKVGCVPYLNYDPQILGNVKVNILNILLDLCHEIICPWWPLNESIISGVIIWLWMYRWWVMFLWLLRVCVCMWICACMCSNVWGICRVNCMFLICNPHSVTLNGKTNILVFRRGFWWRCLCCGLYSLERWVCCSPWFL